MRAAALAGAIIAASLTGSLAAAQPAFAGGPVVQVASLTVSPLSGNATADSTFLSSIATNVGAPAGARASGATFIFQGDVSRGPIASMRTVSTPGTYGTFGLDGQPGFADRSTVAANNYVSNLELDAPELGLTTGIVELRYYWSASATGPDAATDPYLQIAIDWNASTGAWSVLPPPVDTTVSLAASSSGSTVTLDASIKDAATGLVDTSAPGPVTFIENSAIIVGIAEVVAGHAVLVLTGVSDGPHTYRADYDSSNFYTHVGSSSGDASVNVGGQGGGTNVTTSVAAGAGGGVLTLTGVPASVALGAATLNAGTLNASGTLNAVVTDSRQLDFPAWSLTGQIADFKSGTKVLSGKYLGWTPSVTGAPNSVAGAVVLPAPGSVSGLTTVSTLATGAPNNVEVSNVSALLQLKAPKNTPAGDYSAVLTLTLI
ncbi:hypothetical protein GCM10007382_15640 [Salinibacterium xinjiangense]|uniref:Ig-like domain (Group 3) n=1 Tax=Salinibacterium xinjiangense TaxID=386302 RepID=A0A2C8YAX2_9MICO|nr:hypothetical protein [Salinibacterium xinjiangense]GGK96248.1 hypothetical protein GCM10007382_15640 [Salinibacterium xinjiangense]SOE47370.1 hypothetical protein SAMN06296378_0213 [Salinibacterium xinjiangense]